METISIARIREALQKGKEEGYVLFAEGRQKEQLEKAKTNPVARQLLDQLEVYTQGVEKKAPRTSSFAMWIDYLETGNRRNYEKLYFESKRELHALALQEYIEGEGRLLEPLQERLWLWCNEYSWELPAHVSLSKEQMQKEKRVPETTLALFSAETGFYMAEILSLLQERLHPSLVYRVQSEIEKRVLRPFEEGNFKFEEEKMNWSAVCAGSVGMAAIYLVEDQYRLSSIVYRVLGSLASFLEGFEKDGLTREGLGYWQYGFSFYLAFAQLLYERTKGEIDLMKWDKKIIEIAKLPLYLQFPDGGIIPFSDTPSQKWYGEYGILARLEACVGVKGYVHEESVNFLEEETAKWLYLSRNLFWGADYEKAEEKPFIGRRYFGSGQWIIDRSEDEDGNFLVFAAKGGDNDEPHNHNDLGHFILRYAGEEIFCDLGAPEYTKAYFSEGRYGVLNASSKGHSVPVIGGKEQSAGKERQSQFVDLELRGHVKLVLDLTKAYDSVDLKKYTRSLCFNKGDKTLLIEDTFEQELEQAEMQPLQVEEVLMTHLPVRLVEEGVLELVGEKTKTLIYFEEAAKYQLETCTYTNHQGDTKQVNRIAFCYELTQKEEKIQIRLTLATAHS
jgi:hypothetical protein